MACDFQPTGAVLGRGVMRNEVYKTCMKRHKNSFYHSELHPGNFTALLRAILSNSSVSSPNFIGKFFEILQSISSNFSTKAHRPRKVQANCTSLGKISEIFEVCIANLFG